MRIITTYFQLAANQKSEQIFLHSGLNQRIVVFILPQNHVYAHYGHESLIINYELVLIGHGMQRRLRK